jgi:hypothetical protein
MAFFLVFQQHPMFLWTQILINKYFSHLEGYIHGRPPRVYKGIVFLINNPATDVVLRYSV